MGVDVTLTKGGFDGDLIGFSVQEDATTNDAATNLGGVGNITLDVVANDDTQFTMDAVLLLNEDGWGATQGRVNGVNTNDGIATVTADSVFGLLVSDHYVKPYSGSFQGAISYYFSFVQLDNPRDFQDGIGTRTVAYPGWNGNIWEHLKDILVAEQIEMALVENVVTFREYRKIVASSDKLTSLGTNISREQSARQVEVHWYNNEYRTDQVYPDKGDYGNVYQVNAGEELTFEVATTASLDLVYNPTCISYVSADQVATGVGFYAVAGSDGSPITPAHWVSKGGFVRTAISKEDPSVIEITVRGMDDPTYAPYAIACVGVNNTFYNSLRIRGRGVFTSEESTIFDTGATTAVTGEPVGATIKNRFVSTRSDAYNVVLKAAQNRNLQYTLNAAATGINRAEGEAVAGSTLGDYNAATVPGQDLADFNADWSVMTVGDFNEAWNAQTAHTFQRQVFGNAPGARVRIGDAFFRIDTVSYAPEQMNVGASLDTTIGDFNAVWAGGTLAEFNAEHSGRMVGDFDLIPLRRTVA